MNSPHRRNLTILPLRAVSLLIPSSMYAEWYVSPSSEDTTIWVPFGSRNILSNLPSSKSFFFPLFRLALNNGLVTRDTVSRKTLLTVDRPVPNYLPTFSPNFIIELEKKSPASFYNYNSWQPGSSLNLHLNIFLERVVIAILWSLMAKPATY